MVADGFGALNGQESGASGALALAQLLVADGRHVEVLYTGPNNGQVDAAVSTYAATGVTITRCVQAYHIRFTDVRGVEYPGLMTGPGRRTHLHASRTPQAP